MAPLLYKVLDFARSEWVVKDEPASLTLDEHGLLMRATPMAEPVLDAILALNISGMENMAGRLDYSNVEAPSGWAVDAWTAERVQGPAEGLVLRQIIKELEAINEDDSKLA